MRPHKIFKRDRYDLYCDVPVSFTQAALGGEIDVPTLGGTTKYNIPAGTQEGTSFRIRGEGIQQFRGTSRGDLFFTVHVEVPKHLGEKQKELLRQFEDSLNGREYERRKSFGDQVKELHPRQRRAVQGKIREEIRIFGKELFRALASLRLFCACRPLLLTPPLCFRGDELSVSFRSAMRGKRDASKKQRPRIYEERKNKRTWIGWKLWCTPPPWARTSSATC